MQDTDLHDLSDDADYAASQLQGSIYLTRTDSTKSVDGTETVYLKDNVAIHPTQFVSERISGRLKLIKQGSFLLMSWIPYKGRNSNVSVSEKDRDLYTINGISFEDARSIRRHTPTLGWQYIIVVMSSGLAYPPLYFYSGGVKEFLATVKQNVFLVRSAGDANVFLVNDFENPLQRTLSSLELPRTIAVGNVSSPSTSMPHGEFPSDDNQDIGDGRARPKVNDPAWDLSIHVLEKFSLVTRFARETTSQLFHDSLNDGFSNANERRYHDFSAVDHAREQAHETERVPDEVPVSPDPYEPDKQTLVWGQPRQEPLGSEGWATFFDSEGRVTDSEALRQRIFYGGVDHELRKQAWPFLLGYHAYDSTYAEREYLK